MKTKYTVSKTGWGREEESHEQMAGIGGINKEEIALLLAGSVFFETKKDAASLGGSPIKRNVKITVVITDVPTKAKKK